MANYYKIQSKNIERYWCIGVIASSKDEAMEIIDNFINKNKNELPNIFNLKETYIKCIENPITFRSEVPLEELIGHTILDFTVQIFE